MRDPHFLNKLAAEAKLQAQIESSSIMPRQLVGAARLVSTHAWKVILFASGILALFTEWAKP